MIEQSDIKIKIKVKLGTEISYHKRIAEPTRRK